MNVEGYEILAELPRRDLRARYQARQRKTGRLVTLELMPRGPSASPGSLDAERDTLAVLALMAHPHLVPVLAVGEHDSAYLVRPHSDAVPLSALLAVGPLSPGRGGGGGGAGGRRRRLLARTGCLRPGSGRRWRVRRGRGGGAGLLPRRPLHLPAPASAARGSGGPDRRAEPPQPRADPR